MQTFSISGNSTEELTQAAISWLKVQGFDFYGYTVVTDPEYHAEEEK